MDPRALMRGKPPSTTSTRLLRNRLSLKSSLTISISRFYREGKKNKGKGTQVPWAQYYPKPAHHINIDFPTSHLSLCCRAPLEECFPFVAHNIFSVHSFCSYFAISVIHLIQRKSPQIPCRYPTMWCHALVFIRAPLTRRSTSPREQCWIPRTSYCNGPPS